MLAAELGEHQITSNALAPGWRVTDQSAEFLGDETDQRQSLGAVLHRLRVVATTSKSVLRLIWPYTAKLYAGIHLSQRRQAARDDAVFNELIARLDEEDDDSDG